jgi:hypothetical protein
VGLDGGDDAGEQVGLVGEGHPGVDVEHVRPGRDLPFDVDGHLGQVARPQRLGELLTSGRVDSFAYDAEWPVMPDDDLSAG